jgi:hypothetical protein
MAIAGVTGGVDTHADNRMAAVIDHSGGRLGIESFPATETGYEDLLGWLRTSLTNTRRHRQSAVMRSSGGPIGLMASHTRSIGNGTEIKGKRTITPTEPAPSGPHISAVICGVRITR